MTFFVDENIQLEGQLRAHFAAVVESLTDSLKEKIHCIALGGGYGRGEGGIFTDASGEKKLYNDLDYFLFCDTPTDAALLDWIAQTESTWSEKLSLDVEFKALPKSFLEECSTSMMAYDLVAGHHVVYGPDDYVRAYISKLVPENFEAIEATRLLWNRGSGLYFARCRIKQDIETAYVYRNHQKLKLALGDACLCLHGKYTGSVIERAARFKELAPATELECVWDQLSLHYTQAVEFKLRPWGGAFSNEELAEENAMLTRLWAQVFLYVESERLDIPFNSLENYATYAGKIGNDVPWWKPPMLALRDLKRYKTCISPIWEYPRYTLHRVLACLNDIDHYPRSIDTVKHFIKGPPENDEDILEWESIYEDWWSRYS